MINKEVTKKKLYLQTFGCQMNERDSEAVSGMLFSRGYTAAASPEEADLLLYNTCSIRDHAEQKVFGRMGSFRKLKEANPSLVIGILGCMAQEHGGNFFKKNPEIDLVCGTGNLAQVADLAEEVRTRRAPRLAVDKLNDGYALDGLSYRSGPLKALVTIMTGCDHRCTYCIVPYTRGEERSRDPQSVVAEISDLAARGFKDVMLLGQNVNSYGKGHASGVDFTGLLGMIQEKAPQIARLRFITSHPKDAHTRLFEAMRDLPMVCEHLHLPVQSGSDAVLKRMKREHTTSWYLEQIDEYRAVVPGGSLTTDLITGFPGETEKDFLGSLALIERAKFDSAFIFEYSPRPGTPAVRLADDVPAEEKARRLQALLAMQRAVSLDTNLKSVGRTTEVLFEAFTKRDEGRYVGRTRDYKRVVATSPVDLVGRFADVRIVGVADETLLGEIVS